jgi:hypothetical protein
LAQSDDQGPTVQIYEDASADERDAPRGKAEKGSFGESLLTEVTNSFSSDLSEPQSEDDAENNPDEENDPIILSFGPFGANLSNRLASFPGFSPKLSPKRSRPSRVSVGPEGIDSIVVANIVGSLESARSNGIVPPPPVKTEEDGPPSATTTPETPLPAHIDAAAITNHVINQLAFSRLSSNPLSGILNNLPAEEKKDLTRENLRSIIGASPCVGIIPREGKDAAGKPLESEYYYIPEMDDDPDRRAAVVDGLRKPSLRNCRKQHKVRGAFIRSLRLQQLLPVSPAYRADHGCLILASNTTGNGLAPLDTARIGDL